MSKLNCGEDAGELNTWNMSTLGTGGLVSEALV
jgi:hypothetical protein